jgi:hypothetical protein
VSKVYFKLFTKEEGLELVIAKTFVLKETFTEKSSGVQLISSDSSQENTS